MPGGLQQVTGQTRQNITKGEENPGTSSKPAQEDSLISLRDNDQRIRIAAILRLAAIRDDRFFNPMVVLLADRNWDVRLTAAEALGNLGDIRAVEPLTQACADENCFVRVMAREAISKILCGQPEPYYR